MAVASLFTAFMAPSWINWQFRLSLTGLVGERGYYYLLWPVCLALATLVLPGRRSLLSQSVLGCSLVAIAFLLKPAVQAWQLGRTLPGQLEAAFGPGTVDRPPFALAGLFAAEPAAVPVEELNYSGALKMDFYRAIGRDPAPCVLSLHGGGYFSGGHRERRPFNFWLARHGYAVATIDYRLIPRAVWPAQHDDVAAALAFLRAHAAAMGIDPARIVLLGRSAGAQLATTTAYAARDPGIRGVVAIYGPADLRTLWGSDNRDILNGWTGRQLIQILLGGSPESLPAAYLSASGLLLASAASPPTLFLHGSLDSLVPVGQSEQLSAKLTALGRPNVLVAIPWASHSYDTINFDGPGGQISVYAVARFLAAVTR